MAEMLKGGVIMDVVTPEQAKIAEDAGAVAVMALERVPADIRAQGGVARMSDPDMIDGIIDAVSIPVMAKARIGHFVEAQVLQALGVDYIDESEVLTPADEAHHIDKCAFTVPFVCGATNLGEALRRIAEGAAMIRSKGEAGTGNVVEAVRHMRADPRRHPPAGHARRDRAVRGGQGAARAATSWSPRSARLGKLPVVLFTAGGIATPADAAMMMQLGAEGVFVGSGIFKSGDPAKRAAAIVKATTFHDDPDVIAKVSRGLGEADGRHQRHDPARERAARHPRLVSRPGRRSEHRPARRERPPAGRGQQERSRPTAATASSETSRSACAAAVAGRRAAAERRGEVRRCARPARRCGSAGSPSSRMPPAIVVSSAVPSRASTSRTTARRSPATSVAGSSPRAVPASRPAPRPRARRRSPCGAEVVGGGRRPPRVAAGRAR